MPYRTHETVAVIERIAAVGDLRGIAQLLPYLPPHAHPLGEQAAEAVRALLSPATPLALATFDLWFRETHADAPAAPDWQNIVVPSPSWDARRHRAVVALATFHASGYVRLGALTALIEDAAQDDAFTIPLLVIRLNDWVPSIHDCAHAALSVRVDASHADEWLRALPLLDRVRLAKRRGDAIVALAIRVDTMLASPEVRDRVIAAAAAGDRATRRACFARAAILPGKAAAELLEQAVLGNDPEVAVRASKILFGPAGRADAKLAALAMKTQPLGVVRALALETVVRRLGGDAAPVLREAMFDDRRITRELARHLLVKKFSADPKSFALLYRAPLERGAAAPAFGSAVLVEGLSEVATADDVLFLRAFTSSPSARIRAAAWVGIARSDPSPRIVDYETALADPSREVRRAIRPYARKVLGRGVVGRHV